MFMVGATFAIHGVMEHLDVEVRCGGTATIDRSFLATLGRTFSTEHSASPRRSKAGTCASLFAAWNGSVA
jgi:hypothetical protein